MERCRAISGLDAPRVETIFDAAKLDGSFTDIWIEDFRALHADTLTDLYKCFAGRCRRFILCY